MKSSNLLFKVGCFTILVIGLAGLQPAVAGNKKFMTINAAKVIAERAIVESVIGLKIRTTERVEDMIAMHQKIDAKTAANIKGIQYTDIVYDQAKDIAKVTAKIDLGRVRNIVGRNINWKNRSIERVGFATSTPSNAAPLKALRAAELDAYSQLAKRIIGFNLQSNTSVENFILQNDLARTKLIAAIYGAKLVSHRWDSEGDAYVKLSLEMGRVDDVMGQKIRFNGTVVEVEGTGAQKDDFTPTQTVETQPRNINVGTSVRKGTLNIPVQGKATNIDESTEYPSGGASLTDY